MITADQRREFDRTGLLKLPGVVDAESVAAMVDQVWDHLGRAHAMVDDQPDTWTVERPHGLRAVTAAAAFRDVGSPGLRAALDGILGAERWTAPRRWGRLLITFPGAGGTTWTVPQEVWHNDFMPLGDPPDPRPVQFFVVLRDLAPGGGGTLVLTGSHRLIRRRLDRCGAEPHPRQLRRVLGADPWLRELWQPGGGDPEERIRRFMIDGTMIGDVPLRVAELTGRAGDAYLMHCDTFHCAAPNVNDQPRIMITGMLARDDGTRRGR